MAKTLAQLEKQLDTYSTQALPPMISARKLTLKTTRKPEKIEVLARAIMDKANTRAAFEKLDPHAKVLLRLLAQQGGKSTVRALQVAAGAVGIANFDHYFHELLRYALVLYNTSTRVRHELWNASLPGYNSWERNPEYGIEIVETARALTDDTVELPPPAHTLEAYDGEPYAIEEQSPATLLHVMWSVVRWASERELVLTKTTGTLRKADIKALETQLKEQSDLKGFAIALAMDAGLLHHNRGKIVPDPNASAFFARAPRQQIEKLFESWLALEGWSEFFRIPEIETENQIVPRAESYGWGYGAGDVPTAQALTVARAYLIGVLKRAGSGRLGQWQSLASLRQLVKAENPEFLIPKTRQRSYYRSSSSSDAETYDGFWPRGESRWRGNFRREADWDKVEGRFLRQMLCEPLHWLGLVAIAHDKGGEVCAFRLSPLGAHLLGLSNEMPALESEAEKPLIIQPNFEIIAYTDAGHLNTLYQLERFATRERAERVAHYKLDRESVYRGLQDGLSAAQMREFLETHSRSGVPQNIAYSLDDWEKLWQSITLRPSASVVEAQTAAEMDAFVASLPPGGATRLAPTWAFVEARFLEAARTYLATKGARAFDYSIETEGAFETRDDLVIVVPADNLDLWTRSKLEQFADALPEKLGVARFEITPASMKRAAALGLKADEITAFLSETGTAPLPANVALSVRGWAGEVKPLALGSMQVLAAAPEVLSQMAGVEELRELLWLQAGEGVALVKSADVPKLKAALKKRGIALDGQAEAHLLAPRAPKAEATPTRLRPANRGVAIVSGKGRRVKAAKVAAHPAEDDVELMDDLEAGELKRLVEDAIEGSRCLVIEYQSKARRALRKVNPLDLDDEGGHLYLQTWDHWRNDYRLFRLDRILRLAVLDEKFDPSQFG